jgi:Rrf2 family protein
MVFKNFVTSFVRQWNFVRSETLEILDSLRGSSGGYVLKKDPKGLRVNTILEALEGPSRITDCDEIGAETCSIQKQCPTKNHWQKINRKFHEALGELTLQDLSNRSGNGA